MRGAASGAAARRTGLLQCHGAGRRTGLQRGAGGRGCGRLKCGERGCCCAGAVMRGPAASGVAAQRTWLLQCHGAGRRTGQLCCGRGCGWWGSFAAGGGSCAACEACEVTARQTGLLRRGGQCFCGAEGAAARLLRAGLLRGTARRARMRQGGLSICAAHRGLDDTTRMLDVDALVSSRSDLRPR